MTQSVPQNVLIQFTMTGQLLNGQGPNSFEPVYWDVYNTPDMTGEFSGYVGQLQNIAIANIQQISSNTNQVVVPTGPAGGDLTGNYPNPTIAKVQGNTVGIGTLGAAQDGYVLSWNFDLMELVMVPTIADAGRAGGDLGGSYPNPTVVALQGNPVSSQTLGISQDGYVMSWTGTQWLASQAASGFTAGGDLSGSSVSQEVVGLRTFPVAATAPIQSAVPVWDTTPAQYDIRQLTMDDIAAGFKINSFTGGSIVEIGTSVVNPAFAATYNSTPSSAQITNTDGTDSPLVLSPPYTSGTVTGTFHHTSASTVTFTLTAVATSTQTATQAISYEARSFGGVGAAGASGTVTASGSTAILSNGAVLANEGLHTSDVGQTYGPFSPSGQKIYLLLVGGSHVLKDPSTNTIIPCLTPTSVSFVNQQSATVAMFLYETTNLLSAPFSVLVSS